MLKLKRDNFFTCVIISIWIHLGVLHAMTHGKGKTIYLSSPIDVVFYSASQNMADQSMSATVEERDDTFDVTEQEHIKEEAKTAEEVKTKEDAVVRKKEKSKKIDKEKSNIQSKKNIKKADKKTVKQLKTKKSPSF